MNCRRTAARARFLGLTLIELLCAITVATVILRGAIAPLRELLQRQVLLSTAAAIETDVHYARTLAQTTDTEVRLSVQKHPAGGSCTVVHTGAAHACRCTSDGLAKCTGGARALRLNEQRSAAGASIAGTERSLIFAPGRGTVTPTATLVLTANDGRSLRKIVNIMGRVRSCSDDRLPGVVPCA